MYNTWKDVFVRLSEKATNIIGGAWFIIFIILLFCDAGGLGSAIGAFFLIFVLMALVATIVWLWENLIVLVFPLALFILAVVALIIGAFVSIRNYIQAIKTYKDPRKNYIDKGRFVEENAYARSYFFGPGQHQVADIFQDAWKRNFLSLGYAVSNRINARHGLILRVFLAPFVWIYLVFYILSVVTFGSLLTVIIGLLHFLIILTISILVWSIFSLVWLVDRLYLLHKRITSICPHCKLRYRIPEFACPSCGLLQHNLVPSSYGIFHRKCKCGEKMPTTFFNGRNKLDSYCPKCGYNLISSDSRQFGLTMVGASSAGKTALITSFFHELQKEARLSSMVESEIPTAHARKFERLNRVFNGMESLRASVVDETTEMYSLLLHLRAENGKVQFSLYDVAGEVFDTPELSSIVYANDMAISQGIIFVLDPLSAPALKERARRSDHAAVREMSTVLNHFVTFLQTLSGAEKVGQRIRRPLAVVMNKMDSPAVEPYFSLKDHRNTMNTVSRGKKLNYQDQVCRDFLMQIGLSDFIMAVDANFINVHFFPVSATGGSERGIAFKPEAGIMDPFWWIMRQKDAALADALNIPPEMY